MLILIPGRGRQRNGSWPLGERDVFMAYSSQACRERVRTFGYARPMTLTSRTISSNNKDDVGHGNSKRWWSERGLRKAVRGILHKSEALPFPDIKLMGQSPPSMSRTREGLGDCLINHSRGSSRELGFPLTPSQQSLQQVFKARK